MATKQGLAFNPEIAPKRQRYSLCKGLVYGAILIGLTFFFLSGLTFIFNIIDNATHPHKRLYVTSQQDSQFAPGVIKPLVDANQKFDIAVTVWVRDEEANPFENIEDGDDNITTHLPNSSLPLLKEKLLFSDTVFRSITLENKGLVKTVPLEIPTGIFNSPNLSYYDLRAGFTLIPLSPSPLDYAVNYSSWIPPSLPLPPLTSIRDEISLQDRIIQAYGISAPLLGFHPIESFCADTGSDSKIEMEQDDDFGVVSDESISSKLNIDHDPHMVTLKKDESVLSKHPYVIKRSFLRLVDFTKPLNRQEYNKLHHKLKMTGCQQNSLKSMRPSWKHCKRQPFNAVGTWETQVKLGIPDASTNRNSTEYAYAPYLESVRNAHGPHDLTPIPVNREDCTSGSAVSDTMKVNWTISYSGRSPLKSIFFDTTAELNVSASEREKSFQQAEKETLDALFHGHWHHEGHHPRRIILLSFLHVICYYAAWLSDIIYWYTRTSTIGISIGGVILFCCSSFIHFAANTMDVYLSGSTVKAMWSAFTGGIFTLGSIFSLRTVLRLDWKWKCGFIPILYRLPANHRERLSQRIDAKLSTLTRILIFTVIFGLYKALSPEDWFIIPSKGIPDSDTPNVQPWFSILVRSLASPLWLTGKSFQIIMNHHSQTFAGMYKAEAYWAVAGVIFDGLLLLPLITGDAPRMEGVSLQIIIGAISDLVTLWQAVTLPAATTGNEAEDPDGE